MTSSKSTKRAWISSALAVFLCVAMLIGTTFAWFTDQASTNVNRIQAGNLDVSLEMLTENGWVSAEGKTLDFIKADEGAQQELLWEPGCTYSLPKLRVVNNGKLALKYSIQITGINGDAKLNEMIDWSISGIADAQLLPSAVSEEITISGTMRTEADNTYQGLSIEGISITVYASQLAHEYDSTTNQYDANAPFTSYWDGSSVEEIQVAEDGFYHITSAAQFAWLMEQTNRGTNSLFLGRTFVLDCNIDFGGKAITGVGSARDNIVFTFDGNNNTIRNFKIDTGREWYAGLFNQFGGVIKDLTVENASVTGYRMVGVIASNVENNGVIENCHVKNSTVIAKTKKAAPVVAYVCGGTVKNCSATDCVVYCADADTAESGEVVGFVNNDVTPNTVADNTSSNVTVYRDVAIPMEGVIRTGNTYGISNADGLNWFNDQVNKKRNSFGGCTIKLLNDINMSGANWLPVGQNFANAYGTYTTAGTGTVEFRGLFDGNGKTISNLRIAGVDSETVKGFSSDEQNVYSIGFFGYAHGTVKNLTIKNVQVVGYRNAGTILGYADAGAYIENCHVENATITVSHLTADQCGDKVGGIIGQLNNTVDGAELKQCTVKNSTITAGRDAGQVIGCIHDGASYEACSAENVTVSASGDCTGANIQNEVIGRDNR